jgi:hypothetical protein
VTWWSHYVPQNPDTANGEGRRRDKVALTLKFRGIQCSITWRREDTPVLIMYMLSLCTRQGNTRCYGACKRDKRSSNTSTTDADKAQSQSPMDWSVMILKTMDKKLWTTSSLLQGQPSTGWEMTPVTSDRQNDNVLLCQSGCGDHIIILKGKIFLKTLGWYVKIMWK